MHDDFSMIGSGEIGGKAQGLLRTKKILAKIIDSTSEPFGKYIRFPKTFFIKTSIFREFLKFNNLLEIVHNAESETDYNYDDLKAKFLDGRFPEKTEQILKNNILTIKTPLVIRSSSLLEDQKGASFAGKYESVFVGNIGNEEERLSAISHALKKVYASAYNQNALTYRRKHGLLGDREEMASVIQEVVGTRYKNYFLPAMAGIGFSQNGYCWNKEINKNDGLVRLVFGFGTRAAERGYVRLFSPAKPSTRPEGNEVNNIQKCSQKKVDVIDLADGTFKSVHFRELIKDGFNCFPSSQAMVSLRDGNFLYRPVSNLWDSSHIPILTMDGALSSPWMGIDVPAALGWVLKHLEKELGYAVDIEFAITHDEENNRSIIYILQERPLSEGKNKKPVAVPEIDSEDIIIELKRNLPTAHVPDIEYLVYVNDFAYHDWPRNDKQSVARTVGKLNETFKDKRFALIGPGRWGSWNPDLGVPVSYAEIAGCKMLIEVARREATYVPEVSFGSHFFQDLIEEGIAYLPVYPDEPDVLFNENIFLMESSFPKILQDEYYRKFDGLIKVIHVPSVQNGRMAHAILNGEKGHAIVFVK